MNRSIVIVLIFFIATSVVAQENNALNKYKRFLKEVSTINGFHYRIWEEKNWDELIIDIGKDSILIKQEYLSDISQTIQYLSVAPANQIDSFFHEICTKTYSEFPYLLSGRLSDHWFIDHKKVKAIRQKKWETMRSISNKKKPYFELSYLRNSTAPLVSEILRSDTRASIPLLIDYLNNNGATRCIIHTDDPIEEILYYLSVSDIAMELLEMSTLCDFYNGNFSRRLFSNEPDSFKHQKIESIKLWWQQNKDKSKSEGVVNYMNNNGSEGDYCNTSMLNNILFIGDSLTAKVLYKKCYNDLKTENVMFDVIGIKLLELEDDIYLNDCMNLISNYRKYASSCTSCINQLLSNPRSHIDYGVLAEIIATEPHSIYRRREGKFAWHFIFNSMATTENVYSVSILLELLKMEEVLKDSKIIAYNWEKNYPDKFNARYRVCDFALLKLKELESDITKYLIKPDLIEIEDWTNIIERDREIQRIINTKNWNGSY